MILKLGQNLDSLKGVALTFPTCSPPFKWNKKVQKSRGNKTWLTAFPVKLCCLAGRTPEAEESIKYSFRPFFANNYTYWLKSMYFLNPINAACFQNKLIPEWAVTETRTKTYILINPIYQITYLLTNQNPRVLWYKVLFICRYSKLLQ